MAGLGTEYEDRHPCLPAGRPAQTGVYLLRDNAGFRRSEGTGWIPAYAGMTSTTFYQGCYGFLSKGVRTRLAGICKFWSNVYIYRTELVARL